MNNSGIIIVDKPLGMTTNKLIQTIKRRLNVAKIGHAGTLDPMASGVVICLINQATKLSDLFINEEKIYEFEISLFKATDSFDAEGTITRQTTPFTLSNQVINDVVKHFNGLHYAQTPPIYSAIKVRGQKLYDYARNNQQVTLTPRMVHIKHLKLLGYDKINHTLSFHAICSKGTYIRSLAVDIAAQLQTIGHISQLRRLRSGYFDLEQAKMIEDVDRTAIISIYETLKLANLPIVYPPSLVDAQHGKPMLLNTTAPLVFIADAQNHIYACYAHTHEQWYKCKRGGLDG